MALAQRGDASARPRVAQTRRTTPLRAHLVGVGQPRVLRVLAFDFPS
jgi:hypothetical protein